jgi:putative DNA primase/helicase
MTFDNLPKRQSEIDKINVKLKEIVFLTPLEQEEAISKLAEESGKKVLRLNQQLKVFSDEEKKKIKEVKDLAGNLMTEKQFYFLKKNASLNNETLQQYIAEGLEFININENVRAYCKTFLKSIEINRPKNYSLKEQVLGYLAKKDFGEATEALVAELEHKNFIYTTETDKAQEMYIYSEGVYIPEGECKIKNQLREIMEESYNEWLANQVLAKIKTDTTIAPEVLFKESNIYEIPVNNGILNLLTLELNAFNPSKIFFSKLPVNYDPEQLCPMIDKFLTDVLASPEDKDVFYELGGFGLVKDYFLEKACMFVGSGRNGKTKSIELLKKLVGTRNTASVPLSAMTSDSPFVHKLFGRFFNLAGDISSKDLKETGMFKQLTGRDEISANRKYKQVIEFHNYAKLVFACNELPRVYDYSDGFWERWVLLEFPYHFVEESIYNTLEGDEKAKSKIKDPMIIDKITTSNEMSGFLNMCLLGLHRVLKEKKFSYTKGTAEVKNRWIRKADSFMAFCMDKLEGDYDKKISKKEIRKFYKDYCDMHKVSGVSDKAIKATLQEMFGVSEEYTKLNDFQNKQEWFWTGIKLKNEGF